MAYRVGIVGASGIVINTPRGVSSPPLDREISTSHVSGLSYMQDVELAAICDISPEALERFKAAWSERWPETRLYADYREMLDREDLDVLTVATSDHRHAQIVIDGAESGVKGIFCEKPIATTLGRRGRDDRGVREEWGEDVGEPLAEVVPAVPQGEADD